jgi:hypothetical protein
MRDTWDPESQGYHPEGAHSEAEFSGPVGDPDPVREYGKEIRALQRQFPMEDPQSLEWLGAKHLAARGYSETDIKHALTTASPYLTSGTVPDMQGYIDRLVEDVMQLPEVVIARQMVFGHDQGGLGFG